MNSKKELEVKVRELTKKITKLEKKYEEAILKSKTQNKTVRYLKKRIKILEESRDNWKVKLKDKQLVVKVLKLKMSRVEKIKGHHYPKLLVILSVFLRIKGGCSYGGIIKIIKTLNFCFRLNIKKLPCENSIPNWVSKVGLYTLNQADKKLKGNQVSLIVDESIRMGQEKQLLVLCIPWKKEKKGALNFQDVKVIHMEGSTSWNGEKISKVIIDLIAKYDFEVKNILSDEDSKLKKASRLSQVVHLPDISHAVATCLRRSFEKKEAYKAYTTLVASYQSKGVNQDISYLLPPKQKSKARFMNQQGIVKWSNKLLDRFELLGQKAKGFFGELTKHQPIIADLTNAMGVAKHISLNFKKEGLSATTLLEAQQLIEEQESRQGYFDYFLTQITGYLTYYEQIINQMKVDTIDVCSDIIESMFGKYKNKAHNHPLTGLTKLNLELPLYCLTQAELAMQIPIALENISMTKLQQWVDMHTSDSQLVKRSTFFKNRPLF